MIQLQTVNSLLGINRAKMKLSDINSNEQTDISNAKQEYKEENSYGSGFGSRSFNDKFKKVDTTEVSEWRI